MKISDDRLKHIISVARQCYKIAKEEYHLSEDDARKAFMYGYCHDVGYEFANDKSEHMQIGYDLIKNAFDFTCVEILEHTTVSGDYTNLYLRILTKADLSVDAKGNIVTFDERIEDIKNRYGKQSIEYMDAKKNNTKD